MNSAPPNTDRRMTERELAGHLASALGETKALEVVQAAVTELELPHDALPYDKALVVLEAIAEQPGLVGISARFVKSRLILQGD